ncbi:hypothetical protein [Bradyrhizobium sp. SBR1B]|uniref:hypothetical protein n=1 Tax=Bradyrhizobium sp. SBR1B TaxID=2663836 RepID=UPI001605C7C7|nr:hypothetical protein [Bradyrhizobium sp. SBR1B]MBB4377330.1 hypothetical protein [Bradyrhizobium sp. SBR1B]
MSEHYDVHIDDNHGVVVIDLDTGRRLSGTANNPLIAVQMVGVLIQDHRERREADQGDT